MSLSAIQIKTALYLQGIKLALAFCKVNQLPAPEFMTYVELMDSKKESHSIRFARKVMPDARLVGAHTGLYHQSEDGDGIIFVNVGVTALPTRTPGHRRWSWPCWKTDRTAVGVVAHEMGHHVDEVLLAGRLNPSRCGEWLHALKGRKVTSYEPVPSEALAETMRLFILNPELLQLGLPQRYRFIRDVLKLKPSERRGWTTVLGHNPHYIAAGERWIGEAKRQKDVC